MDKEIEEDVSENVELDLDMSEMENVFIFHKDLFDRLRDML